MNDQDQPQVEPALDAIDLHPPRVQLDLDYAEDFRADYLETIREFLNATH